MGFIYQLSLTIQRDRHPNISYCKTFFKFSKELGIWVTRFVN